MKPEQAGRPAGAKVDENGTVRYRVWVEAATWSAKLVCPPHLGRRVSTRHVSVLQKVMRQLPRLVRAPPGASTKAGRCTRLVGRARRVREIASGSRPSSKSVPCLRSACAALGRVQARGVPQGHRACCASVAAAPLILLMVSTVTPLGVSAANSSCVRARRSRALRKNLPGLRLLFV